MDTATRVASLTQRLAEFTADMHAAALPPGASDIVLTGVTDFVAAMVAGRNEPVVRIVRAAIDPAPRGPGTARLLLGAERGSPRAAALHNGTAGHALDYDDVALGAHTSAVLVPALLATAEAIGAPGSQLVSGYVAGYEVWAELCERDSDQHHRKGWHPTSIFGAIGAAAACAAMRGLGAETCRHALGIAASMASGLVANFGTMTKPFHAGRAAEAGVLATQLAAAGMTAAPDAIEHPLGFLNAVSPSGRVALDPETRLGQDWHLLRHGLNVKKYPMCYSTHRSLDGMLDLRTEHGFAADQIASVEVEMSRTQAAILRNSRPWTGLDAKFSEEFAMATAAIAGRAGLQELRDEFVQRPEVQAFFPRVTVHPTDLSDPEDPAFSPTETVRVQLADGRSFSREIRHARGHAQLPLGPGALWTKFADCLAGAATPAEARSLFDALQRLETLDSVSELPTIATLPS
ncbi:MAG: MmgE/PrpD family protein [Burkholderiales bacterium]|nr:MAG: MmgE/PrpD family protein [Burkholderiales bacterium]